MNINNFFNFLLVYVFLYPLFMAYAWMAGATIYYFRHEYRKDDHTKPPQLKTYPLVSVLLPCYNEERNLRETVGALGALTYPNYEVVAINDGSSDNTQEILNELAAKNPYLRSIQLAENQGKAVALKSGAMAAKGDFLVCIDGDALLDPNSVTWMMMHLLSSPRVAAVTGNPRIRTRSTLVGRVQVGEFSAIIGLLKRAQRTYGRLFTISGVCSAFRRSALHQVGYWNKNTLTEDIDISWQLQLKFWDIRFEPRALCWILMPETLNGLFKQRYRWAVGGGEAFKNYVTTLFNWRSRRMWLICIEYLCSVFWAYAMLFLLLAGLIQVILGVAENIPSAALIPHWYGIVLGCTCLIQFSLSLAFDRNYEDLNIMDHLTIIWYPLFFWVVNFSVTVAAFPKAMFRSQKKRGRWHTVDRGI